MAAFNMVKPAEIKLLPHLPNEQLAGSSRKSRKIGKRKADDVIRMSLLEERTVRKQVAGNSKLRKVHSHQSVRRIYHHIEFPVGSLIDIYA
jgi:hypothetical protein